MTPADAIRARAIQLWREWSDARYEYDDFNNGGEPLVALPAPDHAEVMDRVERAERVEKAARALLAIHPIQGERVIEAVHALRAALADERGEGE